MSSVYCIECEIEYSHLEVFDLQIMKKTVYWCFNCARKQLAISDLKIIKMNAKEIATYEKKRNCECDSGDGELITSEHKLQKIKDVLELS